MHPAITFGKKPDLLAAGENSRPERRSLHRRLRGPRHRRAAGRRLVCGRTRGREPRASDLCCLQNEPSRSHARRRRKPPASTTEALAQTGGRAVRTAGISGRESASFPSSAGPGGSKTPVSPCGLPRFDIQHGEEPAFLRVADVGSRRDVLGISGFGDVVRNDRRLDADLRARQPATNTCVSSGESIRSTTDCRSWSSRLGGRFFILFVLGFLLFGFLLLDKVDELLFFVANELLAVGEPRLGPAGVTSVNCVRRGGVPLKSIGRNKEVAVARPGDVRVVARPAGIRFGACCFRQYDGGCPRPRQP